MLFIYTFFFFFKQKTAYEMLRSLVGSEMCIRDSSRTLQRSTLRLSKTLWGVPEADHPEMWDGMFQRIKAEGFDGVEAIRPFYTRDPALLRQLLDKHDLSLIIQIHTTGGGFSANGEYEYCTSNKLDDHCRSFSALCTEAAELGPVMINSHSGHDSWGSDHRAVEFLLKAIEVEQQLGVPIVHETHRQRLLYSPYTAAPLLAHPELRGKIKLNADLSHWCCVCEHVFDASDPRDDFWAPVLTAVAEHCHLVHCRVGHAEGPQINHPDAPEHAQDLAAHLSWWKTIWKAQADRGLAEIWAEPEFGPAPYLQTLPFTQQPVSDLWEVNKRVAELIVENFASLEAEHN
eukprot:TRINITY_DN3602_c0_g1_i2.p1 TRINITY_DN3602_c0_g1~~TRINITY_DN3602_c0_g1_i2.p1  ORF type:complete len:345 (-),score=97.77 TRINITY_DN3602_c0_g1_i2:58-1092(-)